MKKLEKVIGIIFKFWLPNKLNIKVVQYVLDRYSINYKHNVADMWKNEDKTMLILGLGKIMYCLYVPHAPQIRLNKQIKAVFGKI